MGGTHGVTTTERGEPSQLAYEGAKMKPITLKSGAGSLVRGAVLAMNTNTYLWTELDPDGSNGEQTACGALVEAADASAAQKEALAYVSGKLRAADLVWPTGITQAQKRSAIRNLHDFGIVVDRDVDDVIGETSTTTTTSTSTSTTT